MMHHVSYAGRNVHVAIVVCISIRYQDNECNYLHDTEDCQPNHQIKPLRNTYKTVPTRDVVLSVPFPIYINTFDGNKPEVRIASQRIILMLRSIIIAVEFRSIGIRNPSNPTKSSAML